MQAAADTRCAELEARIEHVQAAADTRCAALEHRIVQLESSDVQAAADTRCAALQHRIEQLEASDMQAAADTYDYGARLTALERTMQGDGGWVTVPENQGWQGWYQ